MSNQLVEPKTLKGFRDFLPEDMRVRKKVIETIQTVFEKYAYEPLETPTLEYLSVLNGKYGEDEKLIYHFLDHGQRAVAMRYDLTVPTARVIAQHYHKLAFPFKRYQIQPVWRADNTQKGRYRELWQCDADTYGTQSILVESEWMAIGLEVFQKLNLPDVICMLNHRQLLDILLKQVICCDPTEYTSIAVSLDKLDKIGWDGVVSELLSRGVRKNISEHTVALFQSIMNQDDRFGYLSQILKSNEVGIKYIEEIKKIPEYVSEVGLDGKKIVFNPLVVRGLSYYTGIVWEWQAPDAGIGSLGGGGRYDHLIAMFTGKDVPAAGGSFGLERIIDILKEVDKKHQEDKRILVFSTENSYQMSAVCSRLRQHGYQVYQYPDTQRLEKVIKYALHKHIRFLVFNENSTADGLIIKDLIHHSQHLTNHTSIVNSIQELTT
jgi:histidyl-tRNA synthetase